MHVYNHDILTSAIASAMATVITYLGYSLMYFGGGNSRDDRDNSGGLGLIGVLLSVILAPIAASLIQMAISRTREYDADEDGSLLTGDPEALASALNKISYGAQTTPMRKTAGTQIRLHDDDCQSVLRSRILQAVLHSSADRSAHCTPDANGQ